MSVIHSLKTFVMKALKFIGMMMLALLTVTACQKDDLAITDDELIVVRTQDEPMMVPLKGHFNTTVDLTVPPVTIFYGGQPVGQTAGAYIYVDANITHLGELDPSFSKSTVVSCEIIDLNGPVVEFQQLIAWVNLEGDGLTFEGTAVLTGPVYGGEADWTVTGGFGKFENATGWSHATFEAQGSDANVEGMVSQPNH